LLGVDLTATQPPSLDPIKCPTAPFTTLLSSASEFSIMNPRVPPPIPPNKPVFVPRPPVGLTPIHPHPVVAAAPDRIPIIDIVNDAPELAHEKLTRGATTIGAVLLRNLPINPDFRSIQGLFDTFYNSPQLQQRLQKQGPDGPKGGLFQLEGKWSGDQGVDDKASLGFPARALAKLKNLPIRRHLGVNFDNTARFFEATVNELVPWVLQSTSNVISNGSGQEVDIFQVHTEGHSNLRLIDYHRTSGNPRPGARAHRDGSMATIIFQDGTGGLEIQDPITSDWIAVPGNETVLMWGSSGAILSGGRITACHHRVMPIHSNRRNVAVIFIGADSNTPLKSLVPGQQAFGQAFLPQDMTVGNFRDMFAQQRQWKRGLHQFNQAQANMNGPPPPPHPPHGHPPQGYYQS